jgi:hypothetical protein
LVQKPAIKMLRAWGFCVYGSVLTTFMSFYDNFYVSGNAMGIMIMGIVYDNVPFYDILHDDGDCAFMALCKPHFV